MYKKMIVNDPSKVESYVHLAYMHTLNNEKDKAVRVLQDAVILEPHNAMARYYLGRIYVESNEYEEAIVELEKSLKPSLYFKHSDVPFN